MNYDKNRLLIFNKLKELNLTYNSVKSHQLYEFLLEPINANYLQTFLIIASGYLHYQYAIPRLIDIVKEIEFINNGNYPYRYLFDISPLWIDYFKENAYPNGQRKLTNDSRRGVDKDVVDKIMVIQKGPPELDLDTAMIEALHISTRESANTST